MKSINKIESFQNGILTDRMDKNSKEYEDFKLLIKSKVESTSKEERVRIAILSLKYRMEDYLDSGKRNIPIGEFIKAFVEGAEIKQVRFAEFLGIRPSNLSKILNGERRLSLDLAIILEHITKIKAEVWLMIQNRNEIFKIKKLKKVEFSKYKLKQLMK